MNRWESERISAAEERTRAEQRLQKTRQSSGGRWVSREVDIHRCPLPRLKSENPDARVGDVWQCDGCHTRWKVTGFNSGMQWDPYPTVLTWCRVQEHGIYASGTK